MRSNHQQKVDVFMKFAEQDLPSGPLVPDIEIRELRARLILEEALETIEALGFSINHVPNQPEDGKIAFENMKLIGDLEPNLVEIADGCADVKVVTTGTLSACGIDDLELQDLVDDNNLAKFGPGSYRRNDGKWMKPPDHRPPDISSLLSKQSEK